MQQAASSSNNPTARKVSFLRCLQVLSVVAALLALAPRAQASTSIFTNSGSCTVYSPCWQPGSFGLLVGLGSVVDAVAHVNETSGANDNIRSSVLSSADV